MEHNQHQNENPLSQDNLSQNLIPQLNIPDQRDQGFIETQKINSDNRMQEEIDNTMPIENLSHREKTGLENILTQETNELFQKIKEKFGQRWRIDNSDIKRDEKIASEKSVYHLSNQLLSQKEIFKMIWPCMIFQVLVTEKKDDYVYVVLKQLLSFCYDGDELPDDKYDYTDFKEDILKNPSNYEQLNQIHLYNIEGQIKRYDVDEVNTMAYFISFSKLKKGDLLHAIVKRKKDDLVSMSLKNTYISGCGQRKFEEYNSHPHQDNSCFYRLGFSDLGKSKRSVHGIDPFFEEIGFPNNNLFDLTSSNYAEYQESLDTLHLKNQNVTLNPSTNAQVYANLSLDYSRIRNFQNKVWATESLNQGIKLAQNKYYSEAVEFYDNAISMDSGLVEAYVAKGCALANMKKYAEGIKFIDKALEMEPENENAKRYHESITEKLKEAERELIQIDDRTKVRLVKTKKASDKDSYNELILSDQEDSEYKSKSHKKKSRK